MLHLYILQFVCIIFRLARCQSSASLPLVRNWFKAGSALFELCSMLVQRLFDVGSFLIHCWFPCGSWLVRGVFAGDPLLLRMLFLYFCN
jgi:hypothetical protein